MASGDSLQFSADTNTDLTWSASDGSITSAGLYTAPNVISATNYTVTATSAVYGDIYSTVTMTVSPWTQRIVDLSWSAPVVDVTSYHNVYRGTQSGSYTQIATGITQTTYSDSTVTAGTLYYYVVTAVGPDGTESAYSNEAAVKVP